MRQDKGFSSRPITCTGLSPTTAVAKLTIK